MSAKSSCAASGSAAVVRFAISARSASVIASPALLRSSRLASAAGSLRARHRMTKHPSTHILAVLAIAAAGTACSNNARNNSTTGANTGAADQRSANAGTPMTVTGCLQQVGRTYVVTRLNEPSREGVGTTGSGAAVEREQMRMAANAYRIEGKEQGDWASMVGKQVRVSGAVKEGADLPRPDASASGDRASATSGSSDDASREKIDKGDLAKLDVTSISVVSDNCGQAGDAAATTPRR